MKKVNYILLSLVLAGIGMVILGLCITVLPRVAMETAIQNPEVAYLRYPILLGMYATAVPFFYALIETVAMIYVIERQSIFSRRIRKGLTHISYCACMIIVLYIAGFFTLDYANAMPPIVALLGFIILILTILVATGAAFIKKQLDITHLRLDLK